MYYKSLSSGNQQLSKAGKLIGLLVKAIVLAITLLAAYEQFLKA